MYNAMTTEKAKINLTFLHPWDVIPGDFMGDFPISDLTICRNRFTGSISFDYPYKDFDLELFRKELNRILPMTTSGRVTFSGVESRTGVEDLFRLFFDPAKKEWVYEKAELIFPSDCLPAVKSEDRAELRGELVDVVEDFLEEKGIDIPNDEKDDDENAAIIYGSDYDQIANGLENVLIGWNLLHQEGVDNV